MAEHRLNDLLYGHLGEAFYDRDTQAWHFTRQLGRKNILHPVGPSTVPIPASQLLTEHEFQQARKTKVRQAFDLSKVHPEIVPGLDLLAPLAKISEVASAVTDTYEPTATELLAIGTAQDVDNRAFYTQRVPIAAVAGGELGETVILVHLRKEQIGWRGYKGTRLSIRSFANGERAPWGGSSGPVRQLCFAESDGEGAGWLAVRFNTCTAILRPAFRRQFSTSLDFDPSSSSASNRRMQIDPNLILTLQCDATGGVPHADVTFNPWYHRQFAIIDQNGNWSIWNAEGLKWKRKTFRWEAGKSGNIFDGIDEKKQLPTVKQTDGWARICWAANVKTIVMCTRRQFAAFNFATEPVRLPSSHFGMDRSTSWFLDLKRSPVNGSHMFILTSTQLYWLEVSSTEDTFDDSHGHGAVKILMSWRHFRGEDDTSLQLHVTKIGEVDGTSIILYSRLNSFVTVFQFCVPHDPPSLPTSVSDPYVLKLPSNLLSTATQDGHSNVRNILTLLIRPLDYILSTSALPAGPGKKYQDQGIRFFQLTVLCNDLSVREALYYSTPGQGQEENVLVEIPTIRNRIEKTMKSSNWIDDDFIVADDQVELDDVPVGRGHDPRGERGRSTHQAITLSDDEEEHDEMGGEDPYTVPFERAYDMVFSDMTHPREGDSPGRSDFSAYLHTLREAFDAKIEAEDSPIASLLDIVPSRPRVEDIDQASSEIDELLQWLWERETRESGPDENRLVITQLAALNLFPLPPIEKSEALSQEGSLRSQSSSFPSNSLSAIYDYLIDLWLTPLPATIPGRVRLAKERLLRKVAAELFLASIGTRVIRNAPLPGDSLGSQGRQSQAPHSQPETAIAEPALPEDFKLPVRGRYQGHDQILDEQDDFPSKPERGRQNIADPTNSARRGRRRRSSSINAAAVEPSSEVSIDQGFQLSNPNANYPFQTQTTQARNRTPDLPPSSPPIPQPANTAGDRFAYPSSPLGPPPLPQASQQLPALPESSQTNVAGTTGPPSRPNRRGGSSSRSRSRSRSRSNSIGSRSASRTPSQRKGKGKAKEKTTWRSRSRSSRGYTTATSTDDDFSHDEDEDIASARLRQYVPLAPQPPLPRSMANILSQWTIGQDPELFDWEAFQNRESLAALSALHSMSQPMSQSQSQLQTGLSTPLAGGATCGRTPHPRDDAAMSLGLASEAGLTPGGLGGMLIPPELAHLSPEKAAREIRHRRRREERERRRQERHERRQRVISAREKQRRERGSAFFFSEPGYLSGVAPSDGPEQFAEAGDDIGGSALRRQPSNSRAGLSVPGPKLLPGDDTIPEEDEQESRKSPESSQRRESRRPSLHGAHYQAPPPRTPAAPDTNLTPFRSHDHGHGHRHSHGHSHNHSHHRQHRPSNPPSSSPLAPRRRSQFGPETGSGSRTGPESQGFLLDQHPDRRSSLDASLAGLHDDMPMTQIERGAFGARTPAAAAAAAAAHTPASGRRTGGRRKRPRMAGF